MDLYEFFSGGGMARLGFGDGWTCRFANDFDEKKAEVYRANFAPADELRCEDVQKLAPADLPGRPDAAWASFPCQDLSLAGTGEGLGGARSGMFWAFWSLMSGLGREGRGPSVVVLENVYGLATSHGGEDLAAICRTFAAGGWKFGALIVDAALFVPQSRPRLFFVAVKSGVVVPEWLEREGPDPRWHPDAFERVHGLLEPSVAARWVWWRLPEPPGAAPRLVEVLQLPDPEGVAWDSEEKTRALLGMMNAVNLAKVEKARASGRLEVGTVYRRMRVEDGAKRQRAEVRFDDVAGCLRTPGGGSSRQTILVVEGESVRSRLLSPREAARLMGLPEDYLLPARYNDAYHLAGDGVVVPVVRHVVRSLVEPLVKAAQAAEARDAALPLVRLMKRPAEAAA